MTTKDRVNEVLRHQTAELNVAANFHLWVLVFQCGTALAAAGAVFVTDASWLVALAVTSVVIGGGWLGADIFYRKHRAAGDQARRIVLLTSGLDKLPGDISGFLSKFSADTTGIVVDIDTYFASRAPPGYRRIAEMLDESAFFTAHLQRKSGVITLFWIGMPLVISVISAVIMFPLLPGGIALIISRVLLAFVVLLLSADFFGRVFGHFGAASEMDRIRLRIETARAKDYGESEVMLLMADYNAAVEAAPMVLPHVYGMEEPRLNRLWSTYKGARSFAS